MDEVVEKAADAQLNDSLARLRDEERGGELSSDVDITPSVAIHADPALQLHGAYRSPSGRLLELEAETNGAGRWFGLHFALPVPSLHAHGVFGFAARISAPEIQTARACLRSGTEDGFADCFFDKQLLFRPDEASHLDAFSVHGRERLPMDAPWRELIFFLPTHRFALSLIDLRVFLV